MEFWGAEVNSGLPLEITPGEGSLVHLSQACLGELKKEKGCESVTLFVTVDGKKLVLARLSVDKLPQQQFDLVFDRTFELSHNLKSGSVHFSGYKAINPSGTDTDSDHEIPPLTKRVVRTDPKAMQEKSSADAVEADTSKGKESDAGKQKVKIVEPIKDENPEEVDESSSDDDMMSEDDEDDSQDEDDSEDSDGSDESEEETPKKVKAESSKKRPAESASKTPVQVKKAKVTPQKTDGKKAGGHVATPHPAKQAGKTPGNKPNQQTPKSSGSVSCNSCSRTFNSEQARDSHAKAKHSDGK